MDEAQKDKKPKITIWCSYSQCADYLVNQIENKGYAVHRITTGGHTPLMNIGYRYISGYHKIRTYFHL